MLEVTCDWNFEKWHAELAWKGSEVTTSLIEPRDPSKEEASIVVATFPEIPELGKVRVRAIWCGLVSKKPPAAKHTAPVFRALGKKISKADA